MVGPTDESVNPLHNPQRLAALNALRNDAINSPHLARLVGLTARVLGASYAMISLIDANQQSVISSYGMADEPQIDPPNTIGQDSSICQHVVIQGAALLIDQVQTHMLSQNNDFLKEFSVHSYAGVPLRTEAGFDIGVLCVLDRSTRQWSQADQQTLEDLAAAVVTQLILQQTVAERMRAEQFEIVKRQCLEDLATGEPLNLLLDRLISGIETHLHNSKCAVMMLDPSRQFLHTLSAPSLPDAYTEMCDGSAIGPLAGSCGAAAFHGETIIVADITTDQRWEPWCDLALSFNLRSCWSTPFRDMNGRVLGTFAVYYPEVHEPNDHEIALVHEVANVIAIAIEQWRIQAELRASEARIQAIMANTTDAIWAVDRACHLIFANPAFFTIAEQSNTTPKIGLAPEAFLDPPAAHFWRNIYDDVMQHGDRIIEYEQTIAEQQRSFECLMSPIHIDQRIAGVAIFSRDITERKRQEERQREIERSWQAAQRLESLGVLAGGIAHDFNNLLAAIQGHASLALLELPADSIARENLSQIEIAVERAASLTQQMLAYAGRSHFVKQPTNLSHVVEGMVRLIKSALPRPVLIDYQLEPRLDLIEADQAQLQQVIMNLVINAAEATTGAYGRVTVKTSMQELDAADASYYDPPLAPGRYAFLEVDDTGAGMDTATMARIFDPFFTTKFIGRGLGLSAVRGIVRGHGGGLSVRSTIGLGSTFVIALPTLDIPAPLTDAVPTHPEPAIPIALATVLVIDDEPDVRLIAQRMLKRMGVEVQVAEDGLSGIEVLARHTIDWMLIDWTMPGLSGAETIELIRVTNPNIPIVVMSGYTANEIMSQTNPPPAGFLHKPFRADELAQLVNQFAQIRT
ncbi:MAG: hypothetical protein Fur005_33040 [Roseiflexaceae bacterium]